MPHRFHGHLDLQLGAGLERIEARRWPARSAASAAETTSSKSPCPPDRVRDRPARVPATPWQEFAAAARRRRHSASTSFQSISKPTSRRSGPRFFSFSSACLPMKLSFSRCTSLPRPISVRRVLLRRNQRLLAADVIDIGENESRLDARHVERQHARGMNVEPLAPHPSARPTPSPRPATESISRSPGRRCSRCARCRRRHPQSCRWSCGSTSGSRCPLRRHSSAACPTSGPAAPARPAAR